MSANNSECVTVYPSLSLSYSPPSLSLCQPPLLIHPRIVVRRPLLVLFLYNGMDAAEQSNAFALIPVIRSTITSFFLLVFLTYTRNTLLR